MRWVRSRISGPILLVLVGAAICWPSYAQQVKTTARGQLAARKDHEYQQILGRASSIRNRLKSRSPRIVQQARADWAQLRTDLHAWARKYNVKLVRHEIKHDLRDTAPSTPPEFGQKEIGVPVKGNWIECEGKMMINGQICVLDLDASHFDQSGNWFYCVYECPEPPPSPPDKK